MARSISDIQNSIITTMLADSNLAALNSSSQTAIWRLITYIIAICQWTLETLFDQHKAEVNDIIDNQKPHSLRWYANICKAFQYGYDLATDEDYYDNSALTDDEITASKVVAYSAVVEQDTGLRIKVATLSNNDLAALPDDQLTAFKEYMTRVKDAGVKLQIDSLPPDSLKLQLRIFYNPLVLLADGSRADGTDNSPVQNAINNYLKNLPFNGYLVLAYLIDALQTVDGVVIPVIDIASAQFGGLPYTPIDVQYNPDAGYLRIINPGTVLNQIDLTLSFIAQSEIK